MTIKRTLPPIHPNKGIEENYRRALDILIAEMLASVKYWTRSAYRNNPTGLAQDASPTEEIQKALAELRRRWSRKFDDMAQVMATRFVTRATGRFDQAFMQQLRDAGFTVRFRMSRPVQALVRASIAENVGLIRSLPAKYMDQIEGAVMRSVTAGRDLSALTDEIEHLGGVTRRRAAFIARDQNNKATGMITRARRLELGLTEARWRHSRAGRQPRQSHVAFNGKTFDITKGAYIDGEHIQPGEKPNCRCTSALVLPSSIMRSIPA